MYPRAVHWHRPRAAVLRTLTDHEGSPCDTPCTCGEASPLLYSVRGGRRQQQSKRPTHPLVPILQQYGGASVRRNSRKTGLHLKHIYTFGWLARRFAEPPSITCCLDESRSKNYPQRARKKNAAPLLATTLLVSARAVPRSLGRGVPTHRTNPSTRAARLRRLESVATPSRAEAAGKTAS